MTDDVKPRDIIKASHINRITPDDGEVIVGGETGPVRRPLSDFDNSAVLAQVDMDLSGKADISTVDALATQVADKADGAAVTAVQSIANSAKARVIDLADYVDVSGNTDSTTGLQNAVDAMASTGGAHLWLRRGGRVMVSGTITIPASLQSSFRLVGEHARDSRIFTTSAAPLFRFDPSATPSSATRRQYAAIERVSITGPGSSVSGSVGVHMNNSTQGLIRDSHIAGFERGVVVDSHNLVNNAAAYYNRLDNVFIWNCDTALHLTPQSNSTVMTGGGLKGSRIGVLIDSNTDNFTAHGVDIEGNTQYGAHIKGYQNQFFGCRFENPGAQELFFDESGAGTYRGTLNTVMSWIHPSFLNNITWDTYKNNVVIVPGLVHLGNMMGNQYGMRLMQGLTNRTGVFQIVREDGTGEMPVFQFGQISSGTTAPAIRASSGMAGSTENMIAWAGGNPNGNVIGSVGDICMNRTGGQGQVFWVKESGTATNTGWVAK